MSAMDNTMAREIEEIEDERDALLLTLAQIASINQEAIPGELVWRLSDGEMPVTVWREHRGMTIEQLAVAAGIGVDVVQRIERSEGEAGFLVMADIARALRVEMEMLLPVPPEGRVAH